MPTAPYGDVFQARIWSSDGASHVSNAQSVGRGGVVVVVVVGGAALAVVAVVDVGLAVVALVACDGADARAATVAGGAYAMGVGSTSGTDAVGTANWTPAVAATAVTGGGPRRPMDLTPRAGATGSTAAAAHAAHSATAAASLHLPRIPVLPCPARQ